MIAIIPAFNEECRVGQVVRRIPKHIVSDILVVSDHSTNSTVSESLAAGASVIFKNGPRGPGATNGRVS